MRQLEYRLKLAAGGTAVLLLFLASVATQRGKDAGVGTSVFTSAAAGGTTGSGG